MTTIFSLGHSSHDWATFQRLLVGADVGVVVDVRSNPASRYAHFNRAALRETLNNGGVSYVFLGVELGGRPPGAGIPDYERVAASPIFAEGIKLVEGIAARARLALMCTEYDPLTCHRCLLVGRHLAERGHTVAHILRDGAIEASEVTEDRMLALHRRSETDLFASRRDQLARAYRSQAARILKVPSARRRTTTP